jgi:DNA replication protein DnaC
LDSKIFNNLIREYQKIRDAKRRELDYRRDIVYQKIPQIKKIDDQIANLSISISRALILGQGESDELLEQIKKDIEELKRDKAILLTESNLSASFLQMEYDCPSCKDTGFLSDNKKCHCLKQKLINHYYKMSNLSNSFLKENFQTFNINLFSDRPFESEGMSPRDNMMNILNNCEGFVIDFDTHNENLLFLGTTGLGKTFMCNCIAKAL